MSSWWVKDDVRDQKEGRDEGLKNNYNDAMLCVDVKKEATSSRQ